MLWGLPDPSCAVPCAHASTTARACTDSDFVEAEGFEDALNTPDSLDGSLEGEASFEYVGSFFQAD